jgi:hypothetical protein
MMLLGEGHCQLSPRLLTASFASIRCSLRRLHCPALPLCRLCPLSRSMRRSRHCWRRRRTRRARLRGAGSLFPASWTVIRMAARWAQHCAADMTAAERLALGSTCVCVLCVRVV